LNSQVELRNHRAWTGLKKSRESENFPMTKKPRLTSEFHGLVNPDTSATGKKNYFTAGKRLHRKSGKRNRTEAVLDNRPRISQSSLRDSRRVAHAAHDLTKPSRNWAACGCPTDPASVVCVEFAWPARLLSDLNPLKRLATATWQTFANS
jgi:hypothetical protein